MEKEQMQKWVEYLKDKNHDFPNLLNDEEYMMHWTGRLYIGKALFADYNEYEGAYNIFRELYVKNEIRYSSDFFGSYEDYIEEKVTFFKDLAQLSHMVTKEAAQSVPYIDEALIMMDASESIGPYIDKKEFESLRKNYVQKSIEE